MNEKVLAQSKQYNIKKIIRLIVIIAVILSVIYSAILIAVGMNGGMNEYNRCYETYQEHELKRSEGGNCELGYERWERCYYCEMIEGYSNKTTFVLDETYDYLTYKGWDVVILCVALFCIGVLLTYGWLRSYEMVVTDKRIYGKVAWGKRVDLPVDLVSATATVNFLKGVTVSTSSGKISFLMIKNAEEIYNVINNLLIERQQEKTQTQNTANVPKNDDTEQLKKFKELLDAGIITQEEFDAKKKQLLGL